MEKKNKTISLRVSLDDYRAYREKATLEGKTVTGLIEKVMGAYIRDDITLQSQMLAASSRMQEEITRLRKETTILYNTIDSLAYSLFCAFPTYFAKEFEDGTGSKGMAASQNRVLADRLKENWTRKLLAKRSMALSVLSNSMDKITEGESNV